jgi:hypothetical protein
LQRRGVDRPKMEAENGFENRDLPTKKASRAHEKAEGPLGHLVRPPLIITRPYTCTGHTGTAQSPNLTDSTPVPEQRQERQVSRRRARGPSPPPPPRLLSRNGTKRITHDSYMHIPILFIINKHLSNNEMKCVRALCFGNKFV